MKRWICFLSFMWMTGGLQGFVLTENQANDPVFLESFKTEGFLGPFFEPVTSQQGLTYYHELEFSHHEWLQNFAPFKENDLWGSPRLGRYPAIGAVSPTTLRFVHTAAEIQRYFGPLQGYRILHLGAGYGGLCKILHDIGGAASYTIVQEKGCNALCKKYLEKLGIFSIDYLSWDDLTFLGSFDLVIIDNDFVTEELDFSVLMSAIPRGILLKRGIAEQFSSYVKTLRESGRKGKLQGELLSTENMRYLLLWKPEAEELQTQWREAVEALSPSSSNQKGQALTNQVTVNRLGDQLQTLLSSYWYSRTHGIPFLATSFPYFDRFQLSTLVARKSNSYTFQNKKKLTASKSIELFHPSTLWTFPFTPYSAQEVREGFRRNQDLARVDWDDPEFKKWISNAFTPLVQVATIQPPPDRLSVALHVRRGGAFKADQKFDKILPLKFATDEFMIRQIRLLNSILPDTPLYIYLFTDDLSPETIIQKYAEALPGLNAVWDFGQNHYLKEEERLMSDFLSFQNFDCLIRPCSHFSIVAGKLGRHKLEIGPVHYHFNKMHKPVYDQIELFFKP